MADKIVVKAEKREMFGKNDSRRLRAAGKIPAVVYGGGAEAVSVVAELSDLAAIIRSEQSVNTVFSLDVAGETYDVLFQDRQIHPVTGRLIHADLRRFAKGEKIEMLVPIILIGEAEGLNEEGAVLSQAIREIKVICEPTKTPESFEVDVTELTSTNPIHVSAIKADAGIEIQEPADTVIASILIVKEEELEPQAEAEEPAAE